MSFTIKLCKNKFTWCFNKTHLLLMFKELISECYYLLTHTILSGGVSDQIRRCWVSNFAITEWLNIWYGNCFYRPERQSYDNLYQYIGLVRSKIERGSMLNQYTVTRVNQFFTHEISYHSLTPVFHKHKYIQANTHLDFYHNSVVKPKNNTQISIYKK